ncbi:PREDICTED: NF-kappa-B inhibitor cactus-like [Papilio xuthus]|uniref:NF-kappa-B inhibitor cactus-like n=1 Tax=Papilio xuthus TaxID=66420 RepID=A0AAJ6ZUS7_PAPXU|nr:PREDICTED: NF-kappa-B inhibitor cactus-like [Papilio xuthus]
MSAKKETKVFEDKNTDSGYLSGVISSEQLSGEIDVGAVCDSENVCQFSEEQIDSGLDLSECLSNVKISDTDTQVPRIKVEPTRSLDYPPYQILFQQDDDGDTQLHIASVHGCEKSVGTLIRVCPEKSWLDVANDYGHTALHLAVMSGNAVVTRMLVIAGASLALRDFNGETPLHHAVAANNKDCIQALLAPVQDQPHHKLSTVLNQKNYNGQMCVHVAAAAGHVETLNTLAYYGADLNAAEGLAGWTALHIAARRGDARLCSALLQRGASARARSMAGRTPRSMAARTAARHAFSALSEDTDTDTDSEDDEDDMFDSDTESLFEKLKESANFINVA